MKRPPLHKSTHDLLERIKQKGSSRCVACEGSGKSSRSGICFPCQGTGQKKDKT